MMGEEDIKNDVEEVVKLLGRISRIIEWEEESSE